MLRYLFLLLTVTAATAAAGQPLATLRVDLAKPMDGLEIPVSTDLDAITFLPDSALQLISLPDNKNVPFQVEQNDHRILYWLVEPTVAKRVVYELIAKVPGSSAGTVGQAPKGSTPTMRAEANDGDCILYNGDQHLLQYVYKTVYPPAGIDTAYKKSGFIHPLWSPKGQVLTRIQAPDHYHHYGVWDPWTHILYKGDTVDCWNLRDRKGTVRFSRFTALVNGPVFAAYTALQDHIAFRHADDETMLDEVQTVRVYASAAPADHYLFDITIRLHCASSEPVVLLAYRYGGLGWRGTASWNRDNSEVLTSEGKTRKDADGSKARWCIVQGAVDGDYAGAVMLSYPANYNYPEPLRIWPDNTNGRGDMYANFSPTKDIDWRLYPGHEYTLHYRWLVFNGHLDKEKAENAWQYFASPPPMTVTLIHHKN